MIFCIEKKSINYLYLNFTYPLGVQNPCCKTKVQVCDRTLQGTNWLPCKVGHFQHRSSPLKSYIGSAWPGMVMTNLLTPFLVDHTWQSLCKKHYIYRCTEAPFNSIRPAVELSKFELRSHRSPREAYWCILCRCHLWGDLWKGQPPIACTQLCQTLVTRPWMRNTMIVSLYNLQKKNSYLAWGEVSQTPSVLLLLRVKTGRNPNLWLTPLPALGNTSAVPTQWLLIFY